MISRQYGDGAGHALIRFLWMVKATESSAITRHIQIPERFNDICSTEKVSKMACLKR